MLTIDPLVQRKMYDDATDTFPDECCGFFFGSEDGEGNRHITEVLVVNNSKEGDKRRRFVISAKDYLHAELFAEEAGLQLLGVYHSHPNHPAIPSEHDRVAAQPWFSYIIISVMDSRIDAVRSWRLNDDFQFEEEAVAHLPQLQ